MAPAVSGFIFDPVKSLCVKRSPNASLLWCVLFRSDGWGETRRREFQRQHKSSAYDESDEEEGGPGRVQCAQQ